MRIVQIVNLGYVGGGVDDAHAETSGRRYLLRNYTQDDNDRVASNLASPAA